MNQKGLLVLITFSVFGFLGLILSGKLFTTNNTRYPEQNNFQKKKTFFQEIEETETIPLNGLLYDDKTTKETIKTVNYEEIKNVEFTNDILQNPTCFGKNGSNVCSGNGVCTATDTCTCNSGYTGQECATLCPTAQFSSVRFSDSGSEILIQFTTNINSTGRNLCASGTSGFAEIFRNSTAYGTGATCSFSTLKDMIIYLGTSPLIKPNEILQFNSGKISSVNSCQTSLSSPAVVLSPSNAVTVTASLRGPSIIPDCSSESVVLDGSTSVGAGRLSYEWKLVRDDRYIYDSQVDSLLTNLKRDVSQVTIPNTLLTKSNANYAIQLTVIDYFGRSNSITHLVRKSFFVDNPVVTINRLYGDRSLIDGTTTLSSSGSLSACTSNATDRSLEYTWTCTSHSLAFSGARTSVISINPFQLSVGVSYTFELFVSLIQKGLPGLSLSNSTTTYSIVGSASRLSASLAGQASENLLTTGTLTLDASSSRDNSIQNGVNANARFSWSCCETDLVTGFCNSTSCESRFPGLTSTTQNTFTRTGNLPIGNFIFTVLYSADTRSSSASKLVTVVAPATPRITYTLTRRTCSVSVVSLSTENIGSSVTFSTTLIEGSVRVLSETSQGSTGILILDTSNTNSRTILQVTATSGANSARENILIIPAERPNGGQIILTDLSGNDVTGRTLNGTQSYVLIVRDWSTTSGSTVFNRALISFNNALGNTISSLSYSISSSSRTFEAPISSSGNLNVVVNVNLFTSVDCSNVQVSRTAVVGQYVLPTGQTFENIAQQQANVQLTNAIASGSVDSVSNAATQILTTLQQNNGGSGNSAQRASIKEQVVSAFSSSLLSATVVTEETKAAGISIISSSLSVTTEISSNTRSSALQVMSVLFSSNKTQSTGIQPSFADKAVSVLFTLLVIGGGSTSTLSIYSQKSSLQTSAKADFDKIQSLLRGVLRETLILKGFNDKYETSSAQLRVSALKYSSVPTTEISPFDDGSLKFQASNLPITNKPNILGLYFMKFPASTFTFTNSSNITTSVYSIEVVDDSNGNRLNVVGASPGVVITMQTSYNTIGEFTNQCHYYNPVTNFFETSGVSTVSPNSANFVICNTTHLTEFAAFQKSTNTGGTPPPDLTALWVILIILAVFFVAGLVVGGVVIVGYVVYRVVANRGGDGSSNLRKLNFFKDEHEVI